MARRPVPAVIRHYAAKYNLDPVAVMKVASSEGGLRWGAVGDGGHAFGPFQLNDAGGVITGRPGSHSGFANSEAGVDYAMRAMGQVAGGLKGKSAVAAIVRRFERPAAPDAEIARAWGYDVSGYHPGAPPGAGPAGPQGPVPMGQPTGGVGQARRLALSQALVGSLQGFAQTGRMDAGNAIQGALAQVQQMKLGNMGQPDPALAGQPQGAPQGPTPGGAPAGVDKWLVRSPTMDRGGVQTNPGILAFDARVARNYGQPLTIGTGTNHSRLTVNGNVSDHWVGNGTDIPASGAKLTQLGYSALMATGQYSPAQARAMAKKGGLYNVQVPGLGRMQIIFKASGHYDHLHTGLKPGG